MLAMIRQALGGSIVAIAIAGIFGFHDTAIQLLVALAGFFIAYVLLDLTLR